jgi:hypothetical protein
MKVESLVETICQQHHLLIEENGVIRVPFLIKGRLVTPPQLSRAQVEAAFVGVGVDVGYVQVPQAQLLREPVIDPHTLRYTGDYQYQVLPALDPLELIETDFERLQRGPYALRVAEILDYLEQVSAQLQSGWAVLERVHQLCARTSLHPQPYLDGAFAALLAGLDTQAGQEMIDRELAVWGLPGSRFLDGWVEVPGQVIPGLVPILAQGLPGGEKAVAQPQAKTMIRAMPTRQLHITAGNAPQVPLISALRLILTKSAGVVKFPFEATLPGALLSLAAYASAPDHPLTQNLSAVYWQGGDERIENILLMPGAFDRVVVWGAPQAVASVQSRSLYTRVVSFNPRYGVSLIGREAFEGDLESVAFLGAMDAMIYNQKACNASQVHYVEGNFEQASEYANRLRKILAQYDQVAPQFVPPAVRGQLKRLRRGKYSRAEWLLNLQDGEFASGVVVMPEEFDILDHPMCRLVVVRPVEQLEDVLQYLHAGVSMAGVYPEPRRTALRDAIAARGVSSIYPLGQCERVFPGFPQDGMFVLSELVDWKNG